MVDYHHSCPPMVRKLPGKLVVVGWLMALDGEIGITTNIQSTTSTFHYLRVTCSCMLFLLIYVSFIHLICYVLPVCVFLHGHWISPMCHAVNDSHIYFSNWWYIIAGFDKSMRIRQPLNNMFQNISSFVKSLDSLPR